MIAVLNGVVFGVLLLLALAAGRRILQGERNGALFLLLVHFVFNGISLLLDVVHGKPRFTEWVGLRLGTHGDPRVDVLYPLYMLLCGVLWYAARGRPVAALPLHEGSLVPASRRALVLATGSVFVVAPLAVLLIAPDRSAYAQYAGAVSGRGSEAAREFHAWLALSTLLALAAAGMVLAAARSAASAFVALGPFVAVAVYLNGKRHAFAFALVLAVLVLWLRGALRGARLVAAVLGATMVMAAFTVAYHVTFKPVGSSPDELYEGLRIDYSRDHTIRTALYAELHPEQVKVLEYRGQSFLFDATFLVPRSIWPDKPYPYAQYMTSAVLDSEPRMWGWGLTTSLLDEAIANLGWAGLLFGPLLLLGVVRSSDASGSAFVSCAGTFIGCGLLVVEFAAFGTLALLWLGAMVLASARRPRAYAPATA